MNNSASESQSADAPRLGQHNNEEVVSTPNKPGKPRSKERKPKDDIVLRIKIKLLCLFYYYYLIGSPPLPTSTHPSLLLP